MWYCACSLLITFAIECNSRDLPSYFPKCHINDPKLNDCILNGARILKPQIQAGIKDIKLPPFNPLVISPFRAKQDNNNFRYDFNFSNFIITGLDDYEFDEIRYNPETLVLDGKVRFKNVHCISFYNTTAFLFYFPLIGEGVVEAKLDAINGTFEVKGKLIKRKSTEYYSPTSSKVRMVIKGCTAYLTGLFDGNSELGHLTNELFDINAQAIVDATTPLLETLTERFLMKFIRTFTKLIPYSKIFPRS